MSYFFLGVASVSVAQTKLNFGNVKADSNFKCKENFDGDYNVVQNICDSKNELEIRLKSSSMPHGNSDLIMLTYNNSKWSAKKYIFIRSAVYDIVSSVELKPNDDSMFNYVLSLIYDSLKINNIFLLPDQRTLELKGNISDGALYVLTFKASDKFRSYFFSNPKGYIIDNPEIKELNQYCTIVNYIRSLFE